MDMNNLISECTAYDYKSKLEEKRPKSWLKSISAFANGQGGSLFFGIDDNGEIIGLDDVQHDNQVISTRIRDLMDPLPDVGEMSEREITDRQQNILNLIKESPTITAKQMSERLSVTQRTIERDIAILKKKNILKRNGNDYNGEWVII